jgi:hypothetical protein
MGVLKFRPDEASPPDANGAVAWYTRPWHVLAVVRDCHTPFGPRSVYTSDVPDTYFTIPAKVEYRKRTWHGYLTCEGGNWQFHLSWTELPHND